METLLVNRKGANEAVLGEADGAFPSVTVGALEEAGWEEGAGEGLDEVGWFGRCPSDSGSVGGEGR